MTNKDAIDILKAQKYPYPEYYKDIEVNKALDIAIKSLEERPQGDLISRSALKEEFEKVYPLASNEMGGVANKCIYDIIDNAPTVELDRKQGEWIVLIDEDNIKTCKCSICGRMEDIVDFNNYPFCHCGADMRRGGAE